MSRPVDAPDSPRSVGRTQAHTARLADADNPFALQSGRLLAPVDVEYEAYGRLAPARDNVILVAHALSGDAHVAGWDINHHLPFRQYRARKPGWWDSMVGPGKPIDTDRWFVVCANVLGGCYGTTGPSSPDPERGGKPYGLRFPVVTVHDWVNLQARLLDHLGVDTLAAVVGGSLGGQQAIEWTFAHPERVRNAIVLAASARLSAQGLAFNAVGRYSIMHDPRFAGGDFYDDDTGPAHGLAAARMLAHITYLSDEGMTHKFGRRAQSTGREGDRPDYGFDTEFAVESYLNHQGRAFVERFDANSYLYITRAMDYYDPAAHWGAGDLSEACRRAKARTLVTSFSSDWLYPPSECRALAVALTRHGRRGVDYVELPSCFGHDAFLVETEQVGRLLRGFLAHA